MSGIYTSLESGLFWNFTLPSEVQEPTLVVLISDWIYGLLPYCGPGTRYDAWNREKRFQDEICRFLNHSGIATLSLDTSRADQDPPTEKALIAISSEFEVISSIGQLIDETGCNLQKTVIFGHGFGSRILCKIAASGLKPAGYILAAGLYSDTDSILEQKYIPYDNTERRIRLSETNSLDHETNLILKNWGNILDATRKGREKKRINDENIELDLFLPKELFSTEITSEFLFSHLDSPALIIHGSGDLDIPVNNAFFLEQKLKNHFPSVSRIILLDCDHWFREMPGSGEDRIIERLNGDCIHHKIDDRFFKNTLKFIQDVLKIGTERIRSPINIPEPNGMISSV